MKFSPAATLMLLVYSSQQTVFKQLKSVFLPQRDTPSSTPYQTTSKIIVLCILIFTFFIADGEILDRMVESIPRNWLAPNFFISAVLT
jgi:hypothetical protein